MSAPSPSSTEHASAATGAAAEAALLDALGAATALIDGDGAILAVNAAWTRAAEEGLTHDGHFTVGANLRQLNAQRAAGGDPVAQIVETGLRATLERRSPRFSVDQETRPGPDAQARWFAIRMTRLADGRVMTGFEDITALKLADLRIKQSAAMFRTAIDLLPLGVYWKDADGRYLDANSKFREDAGCEDITGRTDADLPWRTIARDLAAEDREVLKNERARTEKTIAVVLANGQTSMLAWSKVPLPGIDGRPAGVIGTYQDVSERSRYEQSVARLAREMSRLSLVARKTRNAVFLTDEQARIVWTNPGFSRITGHDTSQIHGKTPYEALGGDRTQTASLVRLSKALREGRVHRDEILFRDDLNRDVWLEAEIEPLTGPNGQIGGFIGVLTDITARVEQRTELQGFRRRIELASVIFHFATWSWERDGGVVSGDARLASVYGVASDSFPMQSGQWIDYALPEDRAKLAGALLAGISGDTVSIPRFRIMRDDGSVRTIEAHAVRDQTDAGTPSRLFGILADVTDRPI